MGMRVGGGGNNAAIMQMRNAQVAQSTAPVATEKSTAPAATAQTQQISSILSVLRGQGSKIDQYS